MNHFCAGYKTFFREALPELQRMAEYFRRGQTPPLKAPAGGTCTSRAAQPEQQPQAAQPSPSGRILTARSIPGRNDPCFCGSGRKFKNCCGK